MKNGLAVKIFRGSLFLFIALVASFVPRLLGLPEGTQRKANVATIIALFTQGVIWTNIIVNYYQQRFVTLHATDGSNITSFKALGVVARLAVWIILGVAALSGLGVEIKPLLTGLGIGGLAVALAVQNILGGDEGSMSRLEGVEGERRFTTGGEAGVEGSGGGRREAGNWYGKRITESGKRASRFWLPVPRLPLPASRYTSLASSCKSTFPFNAFETGHASFVSCAI